MIFLMCCFMKRNDLHSQVFESEIRHTAEDGNVKVEVVLRPKHAQLGEPISLDIYVHTVQGIDINTPVINAIGDLVILERSYSGGGNSDGESYSGRHFECKATKSGWYRIPSFDISYTDITKEPSLSSAHITTKSFRYKVHR